MALDSIDPVDDSRITHCRAQVNGKTYRKSPLPMRSE